jgi:hypothetical protein
MEKTFEFIDLYQNKIIVLGGLSAKKQVMQVYRFFGMYQTVVSAGVIATGWIVYKNLVPSWGSFQSICICLGAFIGSGVIIGSLPLVSDYFNLVYRFIIRSYNYYITGTSKKLNERFRIN